MKWYIAAIIGILIALIRIQTLPHGEDLVPAFKHLAHIVGGKVCGYTYNDMWYYCWSRVLEAYPWTILFLETRQKPILFIMIICWLRLFDERSVPFIHFSPPELIGWIISLLICWKSNTQSKILDKIWMPGRKAT